jgi:hypothetical protein
LYAIKSYNLLKNCRNIIAEIQSRCNKHIYRDAVEQSRKKVIVPKEEKFVKQPSL